MELEIITQTANALFIAIINTMINARFIHSPEVSLSASSTARSTFHEEDKPSSSTQTTSRFYVAIMSIMKVFFTLFFATYTISNIRGT